MTDEFSIMEEEEPSQLIPLSQDESSLRLKRTADSFIINARAKETIASSQLSQFYELLTVKLRQKLTELDLKSRENKSSITTSTAEKDITSYFSPSALFSSTSSSSSIAALGGMMLLGQSGWIFQQLGAKTAFMLFSMTFLKKKLESYVQNLTRLSQLYVVEQFSETSKNDLHFEKAIREVSRSISMRHIDQIVPLTKNSQIILADVIVERIIRHLSRGRLGFPEESRSPIVARTQRSFWNIEMRYHQVFTPPDRIPRKKSLTLVERSIRGLTAEGGSDGDETPLELEQWFSSSKGYHQHAWTAAGILSKTGLRVKTNNNKQDATYCHEFSDTEVYGFAYATEEEALERRMWKMEDKPMNRANL